MQHVSIDIIVYIFQSMIYPQSTFIIEVVKPTCWMDNEENLHGYIKDALEVASKSLNLSLSFKKTLPKNMHKWFIK